MRTTKTSGIVRLVPELSTAALAVNLGTLLALWHCLRAINYWGSGFLDPKYAVSQLVTAFGYSQSTAYRLLTKGNGIFWLKVPQQGTTRPNLQIYSLKRVARYLDTNCGTYFLDISIEEFVGKKGHRVSTQHAWLYASHHKPMGTEAHPVLRISLQKISHTRE